jgi:hypothetical protein
VRRQKHSLVLRHGSREGTLGVLRYRLGSSVSDGGVVIGFDTAAAAGDYLISLHDLVEGLAALVAAPEPIEAETVEEPAAVEAVG